jgi:hypothetical protein
MDDSGVRGLVRSRKTCILLLSLLVVIDFPMDGVKGEGNENEELVPFLVDPVSFWHILLWVC